MDDQPPKSNLWPRRSARVTLNALVTMKRSGRPGYQVTLLDASPFGCRLEFVERPSLDELLWVKFDGLEPLEAMVCWVEGFVAGVEFTNPIHPAVFEMLVRKKGAAR